MAAWWQLLHGMHGWYSTIAIGYTWYCMVQGALSHGAMAAWCQLLPPLSRWLSPLKLDKLLWPHMCICAPMYMGNYVHHHQVHHVHVPPCTPCAIMYTITMFIMYMCTTRVPPSPLILLRSCLIRQMRSGHSFYGECELIANDEFKMVSVLLLIESKCSAF